jgi:hypothetical protein
VTAGATAAEAVAPRLLNRQFVMTWPLIFIVAGVVVTLALWVTFVYRASRLEDGDSGAGFGALRKRLR